MSRTLNDDREPDLAAVFGARITVREAAGPTDRQLFLVRLRPARGPVDPRVLVRARGGKVAIVGSGWVIADLAFSDAMALRAEPGIRFVGGVKLDLERFAALSRAGVPGRPET